MRTQVLRCYVIAIVSILVIFGVLGSAPTALAQTPSQNLVQNESVEVANAQGTSPEAWQNGNWGTNTARFVYQTANAHSGTKSAGVVIESYVSGDAKWHFAPVAITPNVAYTFSDYYTATVSTQVFAQYQNAAGNYSYALLGTAPASATWQQFTATLQVPTGITSLTVFHVLAAVGSLYTDTFSFTRTPAPTGNFVPNPTLETPTPGTLQSPLGWKNSSWGANTTTFSYLNNGRSGGRSVRTQTTSYTNGSAFWYFAPQPITGGAMYSFTNYYRSSILSEVDAVFTMANGSTSYMYLGDPSPSPNSWTRFNRQFVAPADAVAVSIYHNINGVGYLTTDDYSLEAFSYSGFARPLVSLTFDDGWASIHQYGLPLLNTYGMQSTQYVLTGPLNTDSNYFTTAMLKDFANTGHEIASHTVTHPDLTILTSAAANTQLRSSQTTLQTLLGIPVKNFASPYGAFNQQALTLAQRYYTSYRGVQTGFNAKNNFGPYNIKVQNILASTITAQLQQWLATAKATNTWLVLVYHQVNPNTASGAYNTTPQQLQEHLATIAASGVVTKTVQQALAELVPQL